MAVYTQQTRVEYEGPAPAFQPFAVPFPFDAPGDLVVTKVVGETETTLVRGTHYDVAGGRPSSGTVTLRAPLLAGETLRIQRILPITQLVNLVTQGPYDPRVLEQALDRLTMIAQQLAGCEGCSGSEGGCSCPDADPGEPDEVEEDENGDPISIVPGGGGRPGLITVLQLRMLYAHLQWGSLRHNISEIQGLQAALDEKLVAADLQPITDTLAQVEADLEDKAPAVHTHAFADLEGKPTTLAEAGITDGVTSGDLAAAVNGLAPLSSPEFTGTPKLDGYPLLSTYSSLDWSRVVNRPDSIAGYGIKDVYTKAQVDARIRAVPGPGVMLRAHCRWDEDTFTYKFFDNHGVSSAVWSPSESYVEVTFAPPPGYVVSQAFANHKRAFSSMPGVPQPGFALTVAGTGAVTVMVTGRRLEPDGVTVLDAPFSFDILAFAMPLDTMEDVLVPP